MDHNPYETPQADIETEVSLTRSIWWKIYFFIITILSALGYTVYLFSEASGIAEYLSIVMFVIGAVGLYGYVFLRKIGWPVFWMVFLFVLIGYSILYYFVTDLELQGEMDDTTYYISNAIGFLISIPWYFALFLYGRKSDPIWTKT